MADIGAMGTAVTAMATDVISSVSVSETADEIDITSLEDTAKKYLPGPTDMTMTVSTKGVPSVDVGDSANMVVTFNDGNTKTMTAGKVFAVESSASSGGAIEGSVTIRPVAAA